MKYSNMLRLFLLFICCNVLFKDLRSQNQEGHFILGLKSYIIKDTIQIKKENIRFALQLLMGFDSMQVYFTENKVACIKYKKDEVAKTVFDRQSKIINTSTHTPKGQTFSEDSVMYYLNKASVLQDLANSLKSILDIREYKDLTKVISGFDCHLITIPNFVTGYADSLWVTGLDDVPDVVYPNFYFLIKGIPLEYTINLKEISVTVGVIQYSPEIPDKDVIMINSDRKDIRQIQMQFRIPEMLKFMQEHEPTEPVKGKY